MHFAVSSQGVLTEKDMMQGLVEERICPVMVFEQDGIQKVPVFASAELAGRFAKRNAPKSWYIGTMEAADDDLKAMQEAGFEIEEQTWPNKRNCDMHMLELATPVETHRVGKRTGNNFKWRK